MSSSKLEVQIFAATGFLRVQPDHFQFSQQLHTAVLDEPVECINLGAGGRDLQSDAREFFAHRVGANQPAIHANLPRIIGQAEIKVNLFSQLYRDFESI